MTRLVNALKEVGQTFELFQKGEIGPCESTLSPELIPNLVPSSYCRVPGVVPTPGDVIEDRCKGVPPAVPRELTYTQQDVIDEHISIPAQHSLVRLSKNPDTSADAVGMLEAVKSGQLEGIYCVNWQKSALRAIKLNSNWWTVIPEGEDAVLMLDPGDLQNGPPMIAFRNRLHNACGDNNGNLLPDGDARLDAALMSTWQTYKLFRECKIVPCAGSPSTKPVANLVPSSYCQLIGSDLVISVTEEGTQPPRPVPRASVRVVGPSPSLEFKTKFTDETGQARFSNLAPGSYQITASKEGFEDSNTRVTVTDEEEKTALYADGEEPKAPPGGQKRVQVQLEPLGSNYPGIDKFIALDTSGGNPSKYPEVRPPTKIRWKDVLFQWELKGGYSENKLLLTVEYISKSYKFFTKRIRDKKDNRPLEQVGSQATNTSPISPLEQTPFGNVKCELEMKPAGSIKTLGLTLDELAICNQNDEPLLGKQTFVVGQPVSLKVRAILDNASLTNIQWTIPGCKIRKYDIEWKLDKSQPKEKQVDTHGRIEKLEANHLNSVIVEFIWTEPFSNDSVEVTATHNNVSKFAKLPVQVLAPDMTEFVSKTKNVVVDIFPGANDGKIRLGLFEPNPEVYNAGFYEGIIFDSCVWVPPLVEGKFGYIQLVKTNASVGWSSGEEFLLDDKLGVEDGKKDPDNIYYPSRSRNNELIRTTPDIAGGKNVCGANYRPLYRVDSPSTILYDNFYNEYTRSDQFRTYLMFKPKIKGSVPIALAYLEWNWSGTAQFINKKWTLINSSRSENPVGKKIITLTEKDRLPTWEKSVTNF